jgi:hypothetical protein
MTSFLIIFSKILSHRKDSLEYDSSQKRKKKSFFC